MNFKNIRKPGKNRRSFIRSMSLVIAGINFPGPSLFSGSREIAENKSTIKSLFNTGTADPVVPLPEGISAVWDIRKAYRNTTPSRERICINGLWLWQPDSSKSEDPPSHDWGYYKVPGPWQISSDYSQKNGQTIFPHPAWKDISPQNVITAWYQREIFIPEEWAGRRIILDIEYLNSFATIFVDGKNAGIIRFPAGEADLTQFCIPGNKHVLSLQVTALPLKDVLLSFNDTNAVSQVKGTVARRGLCGDVHLLSIPSGPSIGDIRVNTSFRKAEISVNTSVQNLLLSANYILHAEILDNGYKVHEFRHIFSFKDLINGRLKVTNKWKAEKLWDTHTPGNQYQLIVSILDDKGKLLDMSTAVRFGYRELWIDGRDFYLNGTRIFFSVMPKIGRAHV